MNLVPAVLLALELPLLWYGFYFLAPSVRETSLVPARDWLAASLTFWTIATLAAVLPLPIPQGWRDQLAYGASVLMLAPPVAVLGARRPGAAAWTWFVVLPLLVVMAWPALAQWKLDRPPERLSLELPTVLGFGLVVTMGCGNYFGTRRSLSAALYAAALAIAVAPHYQRDTSSSTAAPSPWPAVASTTLLLTAALLERRLRAIPTRHFTDSTPWDAPWREFRELYGITWSRRILERVNEAAREERWPIRLTFDGVAPEPDQNDPIPTDQAAARLDHWLRFLMKRFVAPEWIEERLGRQ